MRVLAVHGDVIVFVSRVWQTSCTAVRGGEEAFVIDSSGKVDDADVTYFLNSLSFKPH